MEQFIQQHIWLFVAIILWSLLWKGLALWKSARLNQKTWFIVLLLVNTLGILEIFYLFIFSRTDQSRQTANSKS